MTELKLARLPDRVPVKLTISLLPEMAETLQRYANLYRETYGREESVSELVPAMLAAFLSGDRAFQRADAAARRDASG